MPDISGVTRHMCSSPHVFGEQCPRRRQARVQPPYHSILGLEETIWHAEEGRTESRKDIFTRKTNSLISIQCRNWCIYFNCIFSIFTDRYSNFYIASTCESSRQSWGIGMHRPFFRIGSWRIWQTTTSAIILFVCHKIGWKEYGVNDHHIYLFVCEEYGVENSKIEIIKKTTRVIAKKNAFFKNQRNWLCE